MSDSRETNMPQAFVVGYPIQHSRSPIIHKYWLKQFGLAGDYRAIQVEPENFTQFLQGLKASDSGYRGGNVTIPHKEMAFEFADVKDHIAEELGAANTLWLENGAIHATNTDGYGFAASLDQDAPHWDQGKTAVILGAGGAARAIIQSVRDRGFREIHVVNRTKDRALQVSDHFGAAIHGHGMEALDEVLQGAELFINTSAIGLKGEPFPDIKWQSLSPRAVVTDIVYVPLVTQMLQQAKAAGLCVVDGLGMLLHQAVPGFEKWFGPRPQVTAELRQLIVADLEAHA